VRHLKRIESQPARRLLSLSAVIVAILLAVSAAHAQDNQDSPPPPPADQAQQQPAPESNIRAVRLSSVEGKVQIFNGDQVAFDQAHANMPIVEGMRIVTADDGRAEIELEDGGVVRVAPNSSVVFSQLKRSGGGSDTTEIDALGGLTYFELNGDAGQYSVHFGSNVVTPIESAVFRLDIDSTPAELAVMHGAVHVDDGQSQASDVRTNQTLRCSLQDGGPSTLVQSIAANSWDQWNSDRDQALALLDASETAARASSGNPDDPGWSDLDYYGDWYNVPGYGQAWSPSGVGAGWDPFGDGYWGYYSGVGYSWISGYSWGWWPYHCGAWNWFDGFGWMWFPGNCGWGAFGGGWYPYSSVWRVPPGYRLPVHPLPVHNPHGGPWPHPQPLIAVNRGDQFRQGFRTMGGAKPAPRDFSFEGKTVTPLEANIHPRQTGPLGEGFTAAAERSHPEVLTNRNISVPAPGTRSVYTPGYRVPGEAPHYPTGVPYHSGAGNPGFRSPAPSAPPPPRMSAPPPPPPASHPSGGGGTPHPR
jgi:hypothetical protein